MTRVTARYVILTGEETWTPLVDLEPDAVLAHWTAHGTPTCCRLLGGFEITIDGVHWNENAIDEIAMSTTWLPALNKLLAGGMSAFPWAWEETYMTLGRRGDSVVMFDVHHSNHVICQRVEIPLAELAEALLFAAKPVEEAFDALLAHAATTQPEEVQRVLARNLGDTWRQDIAKGRQLLEERAWRGPGETFQGDEPLPEVHVAVAFRDLEALEAALEHDSPEAVFREESALYTAVRRRWLPGVKALLAAGARPDAPLSRGQTPLLGASMVWGPQHETADLLLAAGARLDLLGAIGLRRIEDVIALSAEVSRHPEAICPIVGVICTAERDGEPEREVLTRWVPAMKALLAAGAPIDGTREYNVLGWTTPPLKLAEMWRLPLTAAWLRTKGAKEAD